MTIILNIFGVFTVALPGISFLRPIYLVISGKIDGETREQLYKRNLQRLSVYVTREEIFLKSLEMGSLASWKHLGRGNPPTATAAVGNVGWERINREEIHPRSFPSPDFFWQRKVNVTCSNAKSSGWDPPVRTGFTISEGPLKGTEVLASNKGQLSGIKSFVKVSWWSLQLWKKAVRSSRFCSRTTTKDPFGRQPPGNHPPGDASEAQKCGRGKGSNLLKCSQRPSGLSRKETGMLLVEKHSDNGNPKHCMGSCCSHKPSFPFQPEWKALTCAVLKDLHCWANESTYSPGMARIMSHSCRLIYSFV